MNEDELIGIIQQAVKIHINKEDVKFKKIIVYKTKVTVEVETENSTNKITYKRKGK